MRVVRKTRTPDYELKRQNSDDSNLVHDYGKLVEVRNGFIVHFPTYIGTFCETLQIANEFLGFEMGLENRSYVNRFWESVQEFATVDRSLFTRKNVEGIIFIQFNLRDANLKGLHSEAHKHFPAATFDSLLRNIRSMPYYEGDNYGGLVSPQDTEIMVLVGGISHPDDEVSTVDQVHGTCIGPLFV